MYSKQVKKIEILSKEIEDIKNSYMEILELKKKITKIKHSIYVAKQQNGTDRENNPGTWQNNKNNPIWKTERREYKQNLNDLQNYNKRSNSHVIRMQEREKKRWNWKFEKKMAENFPNLAKAIKLQI